MSDKNNWNQKFVIEVSINWYRLLLKTSLQDVMKVHCNKYFESMSEF